MRFRVLPRTLLAAAGAAALAGALAGGPAFASSGGVGSGAAGTVLAPVLSVAPDPVAGGPAAPLPAVPKPPALAPHHQPVGATATGSGPVRAVQVRAVLPSGSGSTTVNANLGALIGRVKGVVNGLGNTVGQASGTAAVQAPAAQRAGAGSTVQQPAVSGSPDGTGIGNTLMSLVNSLLGAGS